MIGVGFRVTFLLSSHSRSPALVLYMLAVRRISSFAPLRNKNPRGQDGLLYSSNRATGKSLMLIALRVSMPR